MRLSETVIRVRAKRGVGFLKSEFRKEANIPESQKHLYRFTLGTVNIGALEFPSRWAELQSSGCRCCVCADTHGRTVHCVLSPTSKTMAEPSST